MNLYDAFADQLRELRALHDLTQTEAGRRIGVTDATWSRWESGTHLPTPGHIRKLAQAFPDFRGADVYLRRVREAVARDKLEHRMKGATKSEHVKSTTYIGNHTVELLQDGSLRVNGSVIHIPP